MSCSGTLIGDFKHCLRHSYEGALRHLSRRSWKHWVIVGVILVGGMFGGHELGQSDLWIGLRYDAYQFFLQVVTLRRPYPKRTVLVVVDDEDFWRGGFDHRTPLRRDRLAELLTKIDAANPEVVALDVDLRAHPREQGRPDDPAYRQETQALLGSVDAVALNRTVVLAKPVKYADEHRTDYVAEPSVYDGYPFRGRGVREGYIALPRDIRRVALDLKMRGREPLDSFASAIARAVDERSLEEMQKREEDALPYGTFIPPDQFVRIPSREVLAVNLKDERAVAELKKKLGFKIVIVGGAWRGLGFERGPMHDGHLSPVGEIYGLYIHANYAEALLDSRTYRPMREWLAMLIEFVFSAFLALVFSLHIRLSVKFAVALTLCTFVVGVSYVSWQNLGLFFDFFVPVFLLFCHAIIDKMRE